MFEVKLKGVPLGIPKTLDHVQCTQTQVQKTSCMRFSSIFLPEEILVALAKSAIVEKSCVVWSLGLFTSMSVH